MTDYPLVSLHLIAYKQEEFIEEACLSALNQDYPNLRVVLSDDNSPDSTGEIMARIASNYTGDHEVVLNINDTNLGLAGHVSHLMETAQGELIIWAGGDDISYPNRVSKTVEQWLLSGKNAFAVHSAFDVINENGDHLGQNKYYYSDSIEHNLKHKLTILGASLVIRPESYKFFGPLNSNVTEDITLAFRSSLLGQILFIDEPLLKYRISSSHWKNKEGKSHVDRYKNGTLTEAIYIQLLKDLYTYSEKNGPHPKHRIFEKEIKRKIAESQYFVALYDVDLLRIVKHTVTKGIGIGELRAIKRIAKRVRRKLKSKWS